jgi:hypothetical protein
MTKGLSGMTRAARTAHAWVRALQYAPLIAALAACSSGGVEHPREIPTDYVSCKTPRPQVCTREYRPVCAQRDTGIRCVTTPCASSEWVTLGNACSACSEPKVVGYRPGACS